jgi:hypothetical protein
MGRLVFVAALTSELDDRNGKVIKAALAALMKLRLPTYVSYVVISDAGIISVQLIFISSGRLFIAIYLDT